MIDISRHEIPKKRGRPKGSGKGLPFQKTFPMSERIDAFWSKVEKKGPEECWNWTGTIDKETGYGRFCWDGKVNSAQRFAWLATVGEIPNGMLICHKCDNRRCQNPNHLFVGTYTDNNRDMFSKGRGSNPPRHDKQTPEQVRLIRSMWVPHKFSMAKVAQSLGIPLKRVETAIVKWKSIV